MNTIGKIFTLGKNISEYVAFFLFAAVFAACIFLAFCLIKVADVFEYILKSLYLWRTVNQCPRCEHFTFTWEKAPLHSSTVKRWRGECYRCKHVEISVEHTEEKK